MSSVRDHYVAIFLSEQDASPKGFSLAEWLCKSHPSGGYVLVYAHRAVREVPVEHVTDSGEKFTHEHREMGTEFIFERRS